MPLNENASQVSFDNFEKENASEKKRKKTSKLFTPLLFPLGNTSPQTF